MHKPYTFAIRSKKPTVQAKIEKEYVLPTLQTGRKLSTKTQQSIKIIAELAVNMNIVVRNNISSKFKNFTSEIGYYSYTNRWQ